MCQMAGRQWLEEDMNGWKRGLRLQLNPEEDDLTKENRVYVSGTIQHEVDNENAIAEQSLEISGEQCVYIDVI